MGSSDKEQVKIVVNNKNFLVTRGINLLEFLNKEGFNIPHLCYLPNSEESSTPCGLCIVEIKGKGIVRSCSVKIEEELIINTHTKEIEEQRKRRLELLARAHYGDCRAPCNLTCPGGINVQGYVNLIAQGEYIAALKLIKERNPLPAIVGRVCPRFCETRCRRILIDEPVAINHLKRFVADYAMEHGFKDDEVGAPTGKKVAIIGGGPAGLSCAYYLRKLGHDVTIFEAQAHLGGAVYYLFPGYKVSKKVVEKEIQQIINLGVHVRTNKRWGRDFTLKDLRDGGFEAIFIATGLSKQKNLGIEGEELSYDALKFLREVNEGKIKECGPRVLVVGGGDVAVDVARSARRLGAEDVTVIYPRSRVELPAHQRDIEEAEREGVNFFLMAMPLKLEDTGSSIKVEMARTILGEPDERGVRRPVPMPGSQLFWDGELVINAQGQIGDSSFQGFGDIEAQIHLSSRGTIKAHPTTMKTNVDGIWAGGDAVTGPRSVIQAVAAGRRAAESIHEYLLGYKVFKPESRFNFTKGRRFEDVDMQNYESYSIRLSETMPYRNAERRLNDFDEIARGFSEDMALREAKRCLQCGCLGLSKCTFREFCIEYKIPSKIGRTKRRDIPDDSHPFILIDANKCVGCERCIRSCNYDALILSIIRDDSTGFIEDVSIKFTEDCVGCGSCVDACPTGALSKKAIMVPISPEQVEKKRSVCTYCGVGCSLDLVVKNNAILEIKADEKVPPNYGLLCPKGRFGYDFLKHEERLLYPLLREDRQEEFREVSWEDALSFIADRFKEIISKYGSQSVGVLASSRCENESNYLAQKFARAVLKTNSVDNCARVCHAPSVAGLNIAFGSGAATNSLDEIEDTGLILVCGANPPEAHPVVGLKIKKALSKGAKLIVIDPRKTALAEVADFWLGLRAGTNVLVLNAMANVIIEEGLINEKFIKARTEGFEELKEYIKEFSPEAVEEATGVDAKVIREAARLYANTRDALILYGLGVTEHRGGTHGVMALANLTLLTGHVGRPLSGICPLRGQNNVQGSCDMGALPYVYPGYQAVDSKEVREKFSKAWGVDVPSEKGFTEPVMYDEALKGNFKGMYCIGYDPLKTHGDINRIKHAFKNMDLVIVQDIFMTETAKEAHVVLPACCVFEKEGTFTNAERRIKRFPKIIEPRGEAIVDWKITAMISKAMGYEMEYSSIAQIWEEISELCPIFKGVEYKRLCSKEGVTWPCTEKGSSGTKILHQDKFPRGKGKLSCIPYIPPFEQPDSEYPFILITARRLFHYNNGSMTTRCKGLIEMLPHEYLEINAKDAAKLGISNGDEVIVTSRRDSLTLEARISDRMKPGEVFMSFHFSDTLTNKLTSPARDELADTPEYKVCAVKIEKK